jgi:hypothetical protein
VPDASGPLTGPGSPVTAGRQVTLSGSGYLPGSSVDLYVYSTPVKLGTTTADAHGAFSATVALPENLAAGTHHLVAAGVDQGGSPRYLVLAVTVAGERAAITAGLASTGAAPLPLLGGAAVLLLAGTTLVLLGRRRHAV